MKVQVATSKNNKENKRKDIFLHALRYTSKSFMSFAMKLKSPPSSCISMGRLKKKVFLDNSGPGMTMYQKQLAWQLTALFGLGEECYNNKKKLYIHSHGATEWFCCPRLYRTREVATLAQRTDFDQICLHKRG